MKGYQETKKLYRICDYVKIPRKSAHQIRKTYATKLLDSDVPEALIIRQMGHVDIKTTHDYYYKDRTEAERAQLVITNVLKS